MEFNHETVSERMPIESSEEFIGLFGLREENMALFREELDVEIMAGSGEIVLTGEAEKVELAKLTLEKMSEIIRRGETVDRTRIRYAIGLAEEGNADRIGEIMRDVIVKSGKIISFSPRLTVNTRSQYCFPAATLRFSPASGS